MKAQELIRRISEIVYTVMKSRNVVEYNDYALQEDIRELIVPFVNQFKKEVCEKQREICADKARTEAIDLPNKDYLIYDVDKYSILNAPEPD